MEDIFCRIAKGNIKSEIVLENDDFMVIEDINPKAKIHLLIFPKMHVAQSVNDKASDEIAPGVCSIVRQLAKKYKVGKSGYRIVTNHGADAGQSVSHIHFHFLAGEKLKDI